MNQAAVNQAAVNQAAGGPAAANQAAADPPRRTAGPSLRPALIVVGLALFLVLLFGIGAALTSTPSSKPASRSHVKGSHLVAVPAAAALRPIEILGTPPADVLDALVLPEGARKISVTRWSGSTQFSGKMSFRVRATQAALVGFFRTELHGAGWSNLSVGAARGTPGATEVLAQRASSDGWFWEAGFVVFPTTFGHGATGADVTRFSLDLYEVPDAT